MCMCVYVCIYIYIYIDIYIYVYTLYVAVTIGRGGSRCRSSVGGFESPVGLRSARLVGPAMSPQVVHCLAPLEERERERERAVFLLRAM